MSTDENQQADQPQRFNMRQVIADQKAMIQQLLSRGGGERSSVELTRNAKGETQISVTVRGDDESLTTADLVYDKAVQLYDQACAKFPAGSGYVRNEGQNAGPE
jgi:hypothetical protein